MKKGLFFLVLTLICSMGFAQLQVKPTWTKVLSDNPATFQTQLLSSTENSIKVNVQVPGFYTTNVNTPNGEAKVITLPKSVSTANAGEPDMPMTGIPVMIGDKARMNVRVLSAQYTDFEGIEVAPSKGDFPRSIDPATVPYTYGECYQQDAFFPASSVELYEPYIIRDFRGQNIAVYPFAYNPVTKTLRVYHDMTIEMYKVDNKGANVIESRRSNVVKMDPDFKSIYQRHFINYEAGTAKYTPVDEEGDLLIICYDNFISYMTDFVNWKKTRGVNTTIVGTSTAGSSYSAIYNYIKSQYNSNSNLAHVLLVGDVAQIPGYSYSGGGSSYSGLGDNAYGQVAGSDYYNDIFIGRFSAQTAAQVTTQVNRSIYYERDLTTSDTWLNKADGIGKQENASGHNGEDDYEHIDNIRTDLLNWGYSTVYQDYENASGYTGTASSISSHVNGGVGIINYCNHGNNQLWGVAYYSNTHVNQLTNSNKLPFIWSVACLVGKYDNTSTSYGSNYTIGQNNDCFAESWMHATYSSSDLTPTGAIGGAFSYISQPWLPPMYAQDEMVDILVESYSSNIKHTLAGTSVNGMMKMFDQYGTSETSAVGTYQAWVIYGDPSLMLRTKTPQAMTVSHDGAIDATATTYTVNVSNGNGALATITNADHEILGKATVSNGTATISISGTMDVNEELTLCVFGYNKVTYLGTIEVVGGTQYTISASASPSAGGTVSGAGTYYESTQCTLTATANTGYEFTNWKKGSTVVSTNATYTFTVSSSTSGSYTATFTKLTAHSITCNSVSNGTISADKTSAYKGETVTLTATPAAGYIFNGWTVNNGDVTVTNNQFTMPDSDVTVTATFVQGLQVTLASVANGSISADPLYALQGTTINLTATPAAGYEFDSWVVYKTGDSSTTVTVNGDSFTMPNYDVTVSANFVLGPTDLTVYDGTSTNQYIPMYGYYFDDYTKSECIIPASELTAMTGCTVSAITFYPSSVGSTNSTWSSTSQTVFLKEVSSTTLGGSYSGTSGATTVKEALLEMPTAGQAYTITFDTPYTYNGGNLLIGVYNTDDGSYNKVVWYGTSGLTSGVSAYGSNASSLSSVGYTAQSFLPKTTFTYMPTSSANSFAITASANPSAGGTVTGAGTYYENGTCTLTATANTGYTFVNWTKNGTQVSTSASYSFTVTADADFVANFTINSYNVSATANPTAGGTITGTGSYNHGATATLTANANEGHTFTNWTKGGTVVSTNATYSFTVTEATTLVANFSVNNYNITASANPAEGGSVTVESSRNRETLTYDFEDGTQGWTVFQGSTGNSPNNWMHNTSYPTSNNDFSSGYGYNSSDGFMLSESYISGSSSGSGTVVTPDNYLVSPQVRLGGSISFYAGARNTSYCAEKFSVVVSTTDNNNASSFTTVHTWTLSLDGAGYNSTAYTADLSAFEGQTGYVAIRHHDCSDQWFICVDDITIVEGEDTSTGDGTFAYGETCTVTATPNSDYHFVNWTENGTAVSANATYSFTVTGDRELVANFSQEEEVTYSITASANPTAGGTVNGAGTYVENSTCTLTATANEGYTFTNWTKNGTQVSTDASYSFTVTADAAYVANFTINSYAVSATANPTAGGTVTGAGTFNYGATATLTATANEGYTFTNWTKNGTVVSTNANYSFTVTEATTLVANFTINSYAVSATANPTAGGTITGAGNYNHGATATLTATAAEGYLFINWTENGVEIGTEETLTFTVTEDHSVVAHFDIAASHVISLSSGFNWFSTYVNLEGEEGLETLEEALGDNGIIIKSKTQYAMYSNDTWAGSLTSYDITQMYMIKTNAAVDITVTGGTVDPSKYPITIANGWNWIGYPVSQALDVNDALGNMSCTEEDVLKSRNGFTTYIDGYGWWGSLNTLNPGEGYQYQSKASSTVSFTYPSSRTNILRANIGTEGNYWTPNDDFANNINIMASIPADAVVNASEDVEIGAFVNNECRGSAKLMYVEPLDSYIAFLTVYGEEDELVTFNVYAEGNQYETSEQVVFTEDAVIGKATNPFMLHLNGDNSLSLFPNPANKGERVTIELNGNVDLDNAVIEVYNTLGSLVRTERLSQSNKTMESLQNSGIYTIKVTDANGNTFIGKLIVR